MAVAVDEALHEFRWSSHHCSSTPSHSLLSLRCLRHRLTRLAGDDLDRAVPHLVASDLDAWPAASGDHLRLSACACASASASAARPLPHAGWRRSRPASSPPRIRVRVCQRCCSRRSRCQQAALTASGPFRCRRSCHLPVWAWRDGAGPATVSVIDVVVPLLFVDERPVTRPSAP